MKGISYCHHRRKNNTVQIKQALNNVIFNKKWLFVKSGGEKSSITLRDSKLNKLFKVVEFFYPIR